MHYFFGLFPVDIFYSIKTQILIIPSLFLFLEELGLPLPIPGDIIVAYTGYEASRGRAPYFLVFFTFVIAILFGSSILFFLSRRWGNFILMKVGLFFRIDEKKIKTIKSNFLKHRILFIIIGRHIPGFRIPITIFSGLSKIRYKEFILSVLVSIIFWITFYLYLGVKLGPKTIIIFHESFLKKAYIIIPLIFIAVFVYYFIIRRRK